MILGGAAGSEGLNAENAIEYLDRPFGVSIDVAAGEWPDGDTVRQIQVIDTGEGPDSVVVDESIRQVSLAGGKDFGRVTAGRALLSGGNDDDRLVAGPDGNGLGGGAGVDELIGGIGDDTLLGTHGSLFIGGAGDDSLTIDGDDNPSMLSVLRAGPGDDDISNSVSDDDIDAGFGIDSLRHGYSFTDPRPVSIDLAQGTATGWGRDTVLGVENVFGSSGTDAIAGSGVSNELLGGSGADIIRGRGGADRILGQPSDDTLFGGRGDDLLHGGDGIDSADGGRGVDSCPMSETLTACES